MIGVGTLRALNVPLAQRVKQIELAMERMRWLPELDDRPNFFVNVPLFRMWATDPRGADEPLRMNVVVGQSLNHQTPLFVEQLEYVIFRPYWNPPYGITVKEIVPKARRDPGYMARENLEIVASGADNAPALEPTPENLSKVVAGKLSIRQKPGEKNSLGLAKFIFPNAEAIYMHGTPAQQLFSRARRDFSHGCIRLEDPARLRRVGAARSARMDAGPHRCGDEGRPADTREPQAADHRGAVLRHRARELRERGVLRRGHLRARSHARRRARAGLSVSHEGVRKAARCRAR